MTTYWSRERGLNPYAYEAYRRSAEAQGPGHCHPPVLGALIIIGAEKLSEELGATIYGYDANGFAWRSLGDETVTGWLLWKDERGLDPSVSNGTWDWQ